jgi:acyl dehydratase
MDRPTEGETYTFERTFVREDVRNFGDVSRDTQRIHTEPDDEGRLVVHGLLTATLPTKIGGDLEVLAREMEFTFHRPVYTGDTVTCTWTNERVDEDADRFEVEASVDCRRDRERVLTGTVDGIIWK